MSTRIGCGDVASRRDLIQIVCLAVSLGLIVAWTSLSLRFETRGDVVHNLHAVLQGRPFIFGDEQTFVFPFYNRILFAAVHQALSRLLPGLSESQWYLVLRVLSFIAAFVAFAVVCLRGIGGSRRDVVLAMSLLGISVMVTFAFPWEETSDALDLLALSLGTAAALSNRFLVCLLLSILFAANRESAAYLGVIWFFLSPAPRLLVRRILESVVVCVLSYGTTLAIRSAIVGWPHGGNQMALGENMHRLAQAVLHFNPLHWLALSVAAAVLLLFNVDFSRRLARKFLWLAGLFLLPALVFGLINEPRIHLPSILMIAFAISARGDPYGTVGACSTEADVSGRHP